MIGSGAVVDALIGHRHRHLRPRKTLQDAVILDTIIHHGPLTQHEIQLHMGLAHGSISPRLTDLDSRGVLVSLGPQPRRWTLNGEAARVIGIDFARTHVRVLLADLALEKLAGDSQYLDVAEDGEAALAAAAAMVGKLLQRCEVPRTMVLGAGAALCGPWHHKHRVASSTIMPGWRDIDPERRLRDLLQVPVMVDNDANLGGLGEVARGAAQGCGDVVYLMATSGIGCGLVLNGMVYRGVTGLAGEVGHTVIDSAAASAAGAPPLCPECGHGCIDKLFSSREYINEFEGPHQTNLAAISPHKRIDYVIREAVQEGDRACRGALERRAETLGLVLANLCTLFSPERAVVGGAVMSGARDVVLGPLLGSFRRYVAPGAELTPVLPAALGSEAEAFGAAALVLREPSPAVLERRRALLGC